MIWASLDPSFKPAMLWPMTMLASAVGALASAPTILCATRMFSSPPRGAKHPRVVRAPQRQPCIVEVSRNVLASAREAPSASRSLGREMWHSTSITARRGAAADVVASMSRDNRPPAPAG